ncbi:MAG: DEAD/DEAH box helicase family protein, partial [Planctomycetes bacterium]|nr:DEAD/DEAH box helicase family protein [Planctomycetota bacterium]
MSDHQRSLFETEATPWEEVEGSEELVATVVFATGPSGQFDYAVDDRLAEQVEAGRRVRVPLGRSNRILTGYCVQVAMRPTGRQSLKPVKGVVDHRSLLSPSMLRLTEWIAEHYLCPWGQVLEAVVPAGVRGQAGTRTSKVLSVAPEVAGKLGALKLPEKQALVMKVLAEASEPLIATELARAAKCTLAPITALKRKGLILVRSERLAGRRAAEPTVDQEDHLVLNPDQEAALAVVLEALNASRHETVLIHGVTGSGKTEVYIQAIREVVGFGRQAIVLVPEISLTPQTIRRFRSRFPSVAVLHSHLSDAERHWQWQQIARGGVQVVVGARSAVFA